MINYTKHQIDNFDIRSVVNVLRSKSLTQGSQVLKFEKKLCRYFGAKYSIALNSATSALHLTCEALKNKNYYKKQIVWTSPNSFVASSNCALLSGMKVDFVDIDLNTFNISISSLKKKLELSKKIKKLPSIIIVVHFGGLPCDMKEIYNLSKKYKFKIIEDASHAAGSKYFNTKIGDCFYSDATIFSFHAAKNFTTGEGGAVLSNNKDLIKKISSLRTHGIMNKNQFDHKRWFYEQNFLGLNYRMTDIQAALGISQLNKLSKWVTQRNKIASSYKKNLFNSYLKLQEIPRGYYSSYHLMVILVNSKKINRNELYNYLFKNKIMCNVHYIPIYRHNFYKRYRRYIKSYKKCETYFKKALTLPLYPSLTQKNQNKIIRLINKVL